MKRLIASMVLALTLIAPSIASAAQGFYLAPKFMMTVQNTGTVERSGNLAGYGVDNHSQFTLGGAIAAGYDFWFSHMIPIRAELELALRGNGENSENGRYGDTKLTTNSTTLLANFYYDFHNSTAFTPYVGAGIGLAFNYLGVDVHDSAWNRGYSCDDRSTNFAWQVGAGVAYSFNENIAVDAGYRYLDLGYTETKTNGYNVGIRPYNHEVMLGLRIGF